MERNRRMESLGVPPLRVWTQGEKRKLPRGPKEKGCRRRRKDKEDMEMDAVEELCCEK